jgi:simple sugar transport system ATP-binding protein
MVHQHFMLVPVFTVAENVTLGSEPVRRLATPAFHLGGLRVPPLGLPSIGFLDRRTARREVLALSERFGLRVDPDAPVEELPVGVQQRVEIIKALLRDAQVLVLDEPTAVLTPHETEDLFRIMRELREGGRSIIFISHKLKEVQAIADTITVIRRGKVVGERPPATSSTELASLMVGRSVQLRVSKEPAKPGDVVLDVQDLTVAGERGERSVRDVSFQVRAGEILGMAGVQGNGQTELCEALMGLRPSTGSVLLNGTDLSHAPTRARLHAGIGYVPEDRSEDGLVADFSVADNLILDLYDQPPYASGIALNLDAIRESAVLDAVRRQPAEGRGRARDGPGRQAAARQPANPGPRCRVDRVRAQTPGRPAGRGRCGADRLIRARRDLRPGRPHRRHVRGPDRRVPPAHHLRTGAGPANGRQRPNWIRRPRLGGGAADARASPGAEQP